MLNFLKILFTGNNKKNNNVQPSETAFSIQLGKPTDKEISELLKKATALKKIDIDQAIDLIKKVLTIDPEYPCHDKLKSYLILANRIDEAEELILKLIGECQSNSFLFNFSKRAGNYQIYADLLFKKELYKEYIFYYSLSFYNELVADVFNEALDSVKANLNYLKNKEIFIDKKTNKAFQEINAKLKQDLFIKTFHEILMEFNFIELYKLVFFLINKQPQKEELEIYAIKYKKEDWLLWSNQKFQEIIPNYYQEVFVRQYKCILEPIFK
jgi:hypothetical protein